MKKAKVIKALLMICVTMPIWFFLMYRILQGVNASELMWFLYWVYMPVGFFCGILGAVADD